MLLTEAEIIEKAEKKANPVITDNIKRQNDHKVHIYGAGFEYMLRQIIGYENIEQFNQKKLLSKPFTRPIFKKIINAQSRWKTAWGTNKYYNFGDNLDLSKDFEQDVLSQAWKGASIGKMVKDFLARAIYEEFGGFLMVERGRVVAEDGKRFEVREGIRRRLKDGEEPKPYIIFIAADDVHDFKITGETVEYIVIKFGHAMIEGNKVPLLRVIDDETDYIVELQYGKAKISEEEGLQPIAHDAGSCPVTPVTHIKSELTKDDHKTSPVDDIIQLLDYYLHQFAEHLVTEILHAHPNYFQVATRCMHEYRGIRCNDGQIQGEHDGETINEECPKCKGLGHNLHKDASTTIIIPPLDEEGKAFNITNVAGYVSPPVDALKYQQAAIDWMEEKILSAALGLNNVTQQDKLEKTATETVINLKPLEDIINDIIDVVEAVEARITDFIGRIYSEKYIGSEINYGRKLNLRDENTLLKEIAESKAAGVGQSYIKSLTEELTHARFMRSPLDLRRNLILNELEPLAGYTFEEVEAGQNIASNVKRLKQNFTDYIARFERENGDISLVKSDITAIREVLMGYVAEDIKEMDIIVPSPDIVE